MSENTTMDFDQSIQRPKGDVYYAFTNQAALTQWLCDNAQVDLQEGGAFFFNWNRPKYFAVGEYTDIEPGDRLAFTWQGRGEPEPTRVEVRFDEVEGVTEVSLSHQGLGSGPDWVESREQIDRGWKFSLDNLKQVLEEGLDKRIYDRPFLGLLIVGLVSADEIKSLGLEAEGGIRISGALAGTGAEAAGLQDQDIIISVDNHEMSSFAKLQKVLGDHQIGDSLEITYFRNGEKQSSTLTLSSRPLPEIPETPAELAAAAKDEYKQIDEELDALVSGLPEASAIYKASPDAWSAKEIMAHLLTTERGFQMWLASLADHRRLIGWPNNPQAWITAAVESFSMSEILTTLKAAEAETVKLLANLPDDTVRRKATYIDIGNNAITFFPNHTRGHFSELRKAITVAMEAENS